jgi:hypothetical protein
MISSNLLKIEEFQKAFWKIATDISEYQLKYVENYQEMLFGSKTAKSFIGMAPQYLWQPIFSNNRLFGIEYHGDRQIEQEIVKKAGYGSQLGTIIDFLDLIEKTNPLPTNNLTTQKKKDVYYRYKALSTVVSDVKKNFKK